MVDESSVYITGSEPDWAVQKALDSILATLNQTQKVSKEQEKQIREATKGGKMLDKKAWKEWTSGLKDATATGIKHGKTNKRLIETTKDLNKEFKETSKTFKAAALGAGMIGSVFGALYTHFDETIKTFAELNDAGISNAMSVKGLTKQLAKMGMGLDQFQAIAQRYTTVIGKMGMQQFTDVVTGVGKNFHTFGLSMAEGAEWAAEYLQQQRLLGNFSIYNQRGLNEAVRSNIDRLTAYSKVLNVSRSELQAAQTEAAGDAMVQARLMAMGSKSAEEANKAYLDIIARFTSFGAQGMADSFRQMFGFDDPEMSSAFEELAGTSASGILQMYKDLHAKATAGIMPTDADFEALGAEAQRFIKDQGYTVLEAMQGNNQGIKDIAKLALGYQEYMSLTPEQKKARAEEATQAQRLVQVTAALNTNLDKLKGSASLLALTITEKLIKLLGGTTAEGTMAGGMQAVADAAGAAADWLMELAEGKVKWTGEDGIFAKVGASIWTGIQKGFKAVIDGAANLIREGIDKVAEAIRNWSPFNRTHSVDMNTVDNQVSAKGYAGVTPGTLGYNAAQLAEARKFLAGAQANVYQAQGNYDRTGKQKYKDHLDRKVEEYLDAAEIVRQLVLTRQAIYKQTEATEEGNG